MRATTIYVGSRLPSVRGHAQLPHFPTQVCSMKRTFHGCWTCWKTTCFVARRRSPKVNSWRYEGIPRTRTPFGAWSARLPWRSSTWKRCLTWDPLSGWQPSRSCVSSIFLWNGGCRGCKYVHYSCYSRRCVRVSSFHRCTLMINGSLDTSEIGYLLPVF